MKKTIKALAGAAAVAAVFASTPASAVNLVLNGGFESPTISDDSFQTLSGGALSNWTIAGNIDLVREDYWDAKEGLQSVDLNGSVAGAIRQSITLAGGQLYKLSFWMSGNPEGPPPVKSMTVGITGDSSAGLTPNPFTQTFDVDNPVNITKQNMNWTYKSALFTPSASGSYVLEFFSLTSDCCWGPVIDNVSVTAIPEPEIYAMMAAGLGLMGFVARRRKSYGAAATV